MIDWIVYRDWDVMGWIGCVVVFILLLYQARKGHSKGAEAMMKRDWWSLAAIIATALVFHALFPRYELHYLPRGEAWGVMVRFDQWTGVAELSALAGQDRQPWFVAPPPSGPPPR